jgi:hypothetical protein
MPTRIVKGKKLSTVKLNWKEVFYTNCGMVSASNVDQELGWCKTDFAAIGVDYSYRARIPREGRKGTDPGALDEGDRGQASAGDRGQARLVEMSVWHNKPLQRR